MSEPIPIQEPGKRTGKSTDDPRAGMGVGKKGDPMFTLGATSQHGVAMTDPLPFDTTQLTSKANRSSPKPGDPCHPLAEGAHAPAVAFKPSHFTRGKDGAPSETAPPCSADADKGDQEPVVAFQPGNLTRRAGAEPNEKVFPTLGSETQGDQAPHMASGMIVRRLTPVECCRLHGFQDDHNEWGIDENGKRVPLSDSSRYRQMGNAVSVNVAEFLAKVVKSALNKGDHP